MSNKNICAIIGENPEELEFGYDEDYYTCATMKFRLVTALQELISDGVDTFVSTLDQGVSMWGAEACTAIKKFGGNIKLIAAPIAEDQANRWHPERRERYFSLLEEADEVISPHVEISGENYIFDSVDEVICFGNPAHPRLSGIIKRAEERGIAVKLLS